MEHTIINNSIGIDDGKFQISKFESMPRVTYRLFPPFRTISSPNFRHPKFPPKCTQQHHTICCCTTKQYHNSQQYLPVVVLPSASSFLDAPSHSHRIAFGLTFVVHGLRFARLLVSSFNSFDRLCIYLIGSRELRLQGATIESYIRRQR